MKTLHIACAADDKFAVLAAAMLKSVELQLSDDWNCEVWFLNSGIAEFRKEMIHASLDPAKMVVHFLDLSPSYYSQLAAIPNARKFATYHRLLSPHLVPERVERLLYLDADIIARKSLEELYEMPLAEHEIIAAVRDSMVWTVGCDWGGILNWTDFGMEKEAKYFNAGVLLIDVKKWKSKNVTGSVADCIANNQSHVRFHDQYGLNVVLHSMWKEAPAKWNSVPGKPGTENAHLVHFVSRKPHERDYEGDFTEEFLRILDMTAWKGRRASPFVLPLWLPKRLRGRLKWALSPW